jgi:hypothetical protein
MTSSHRLGVVLCVLAVSLSVFAQSREAKKPGLNYPAGDKHSKDPEAERLKRERRARAQALLISLGTDAGTFVDSSLRARIQSRIADALWKVDQDRARALFRKAWEAAELADAEGQQRVERDAREQLKSAAGYVVASPPEIRTEVLRLTVRHDNALAEEFLKKVNEKKAQDAAARINRIGDDDKDYAVSQRIRLAREILASGDKERAGDLVARDYANKIEYMELRNGVRAYVDASLALVLINKKDAEGALEIARTGELTHLQ